MITADQLLAHAVGDYLLQSHWMATNKTKSHIAALAHVLFYGLAFFPLQPSLPAWLAIVGSHFLIDRYRLARFLVVIKNVYLAPPGQEERFYAMLDPATGYPEDCPPWLAVWLLIIADNILHVICNGLALKFL